MNLLLLAQGLRFERAGRAVALIGVALPLLLIGHSKFAPFEVEALKRLIGRTPWLS
jgi:reactive chlorine resistance protein C